MSPSRDPIEQQLAALPQERASADFTDRLMERIRATVQAPPRTGWTPRRWAMAAGLAAAIGAAATLVVSGVGEHSLRASKSAQLDEMRRQHELLTQELRDLRTLAQGTEPVLYLGSVDDVDYVWDLEPLLEQRSGPARGSSSKPSSYQLTKETP